MQGAPVDTPASLTPIAADIGHLPEMMYGADVGFIWTYVTESGGLKEAMAAEQERFAARAAERFPFLDPAKIKDASQKRPGQPGYNPRTLHIPKDWFVKTKVSEGQKQW